LKGIVFDTRWQDPEDIRKFKGLLAELSGRKIEDFNRLVPRLQPGNAFREAPASLYEFGDIWAEADTSRWKDTKRIL
jgi:hypothetical protein